MRRRRRVLSETTALIRAINTKLPKSKDTLKTNYEQILSDSDKLVVAYKYIGRGVSFRIVEITTVAFVTIIEDQDYTVVYYDNSHDGILHMHRRLSVESESESVIPIGKMKEENMKKQLDWAMKEIRKRWFYFRNSFYKRSSLKNDF